MVKKFKRQEEEPTGKMKVKLRGPEEGRCTLRLFQIIFFVLLAITVALFVYGISDKFDNTTKGVIQLITHLLPSAALQLMGLYCVTLYKRGRLRDALFLKLYLMVTCVHALSRWLTFFILPFADGQKTDIFFATVVWVELAIYIGMLITSYKSRALISQLEETIAVLDYGAPPAPVTPVSDPTPTAMPEGGSASSSPVTRTSTGRV